MEEKEEGVEAKDGRATTGVDTGDMLEASERSIWNCGEYVDEVESTSQIIAAFSG